MTEGERTDVLRTDLEAFKKLMDERDRRIEERFRAMDEKTGLALTSSEKAVTKAEFATEKRFDAVNEFRGQLKDQASTLIPRAEAETRFAAIDKDVEDLKKIVTLSQGRGLGIGVSWAIVATVIVMLLGLAEVLVLVKWR
jgi:hypothetical protein